jgi:hypothetical protein
MKLGPNGPTVVSQAQRAYTMTAGATQSPGSEPNPPRKRLLAQALREILEELSWREMQD